MSTEEGQTKTEECYQCGQHSPDHDICDDCEDKREEAELVKGMCDADPDGAPFVERLGEDQSILATTSRVIAIPLTDEEKIDLADRIVKLYGQIEELEEGKKTAARDYGSTIKARENDMNNTVARLKSGSAERKVACSIVADYGTGKAMTFRMDTEELMESETRDLTHEEQQPGLGLDEGKTDAEQEADASTPDPSDDMDTGPTVAEPPHPSDE